MNIESDWLFLYNNINEYEWLGSLTAPYRTTIAEETTIIWKAATTTTIIIWISKAVRGKPLAPTPNLILSLHLRLIIHPSQKIEQHAVLRWLNR